MASSITHLPYHVAKRAWQVLYHGVSRFGEKIGSDALTYNYGVFLSFHRATLRNATKVADVILKQFPDIKTIADVGCGTGGYAAEFQRRGLKVLACEYAPRARRWAKKQGVNALPFDLSKSTEPMEGTPVDLAYSFEVGEHIPAQYADAFVEYLAKTGRVIVLTCAHPGQGGQGHINEQPRSYWIEKFVARGWTLDKEATEAIGDGFRERQTAEFLYENLMVFRR